MFCTNCGKNIEDNVKFCGFCGAVINAAPEAEAYIQTPHYAEAEPVKPVRNTAERKKKKISFKKIIAVILVLAILGGAATFFITYETSEKALENIIESTLSGDEETVDKYYNTLLVLNSFGFSKDMEEKYYEKYEGVLADNLERRITSGFDWYFETDDYDIDWEIVSKNDVDLDDERYENANIMERLIEMGIISTVFHPVFLIDAVEYEVKFTAQELNERETMNMKFVLLNYNMRWYLFEYYTV